MVTIELIIKDKVSSKQTTGVILEKEYNCLEEDLNILKKNLEVAIDIAIKETNNLCSYQRLIENFLDEICDKDGKPLD